MFESILDLVNEFELFVREQLPHLAAVERSWCNEIIGVNTEPVVIYGMGSLGRMLLARLRATEMPPLAVADESLSLQYKHIDGIPCLSPTEACTAYGRSAIFIVAIFNQTGEKAFAHIEANLKALGAEKVVYFIPFLWKHAEALLPYYSLDLPSKLVQHQERIRRVFATFSDRQSRIDYAAFVYHLLWPSPTFTCRPEDDDTYFPEGIFTPSDHEVFLDGGAFDGDTLAKFVQKTNGRFSSYIGIEPDPANVKKLEKRIARLANQITGGLTVRPSAIGHSKGSLPFKADGQLGSALDPSGTIVVPVSPLADLVGDLTPSLIKLDIEGAELDALAGARAFLRETTPKLAVCVYHRQSHFWEIPSAIQAINPSYKLYFRRHREYLDDVVAYAIRS